MSEEIISEPTAAPEPVSIDTAPTPEPAEINETPTIEQTMEKVHDRVRPDRATEPKAQPVPPTRPEGMPQSWGNDQAKVWERLDPETRELVAMREAQAQRKIPELGRPARDAEQFTSVYEKYQSVMPRGPDGSEVPAPQVFERMLDVYALAQRDPGAVIRHIAESTGFDLSSLTGRPALDSGLLSEATRELDRIMAEQNATVQRRNAAIVEKFHKGKEDHWADIEPDLKTQIRAIQLSDPDLTPKEVLQTAYERAVQLNPHVRQKLDAPKAKEAAAKEAAETKRRADEAKRLASLNTKSQRVSRVVPTFGSLVEEMAAVYDSVQARG